MPSPSKPLDFLLHPAPAVARWAQRGRQMVAEGEARRDPDGMLCFSAPGPDPLPLVATEYEAEVRLSTGVYLVHGAVLGWDPAKGEFHGSIAGEVTRVQRRRFVRAPVDWPPSSAWFITGADRPPFALRVLNVGGGGLRFETFEALEPGADLALAVVGLSANEVRVRATVLEVKSGRTIVPGSPRKRTCRAAFVGLPQKTEDAIVQFVFREEARRRQEAAQAAQ